MRFQNRNHAGELLAEQLLSHANQKDVLVLGLPRGGIPIAHAIAKRLHVPFDALFVRKLGLPFHEELAMGAISEDGIPFFNHEILSLYSIDEHQQKHLIEKELNELKRRKKLYRNDRELPDLQNKTIILTDDGMATGSTMQTALSFLKTKHPKKIIVAVPVASSSAREKLMPHADEFISLIIPDYFEAVGEWYMDFQQTTDEEVCALLRK